MKLRKLNRDRNSRVALFKNLLSSLVRDGELKTTYAKASSARRLADKMIQKAISGRLHDRRLVQADLQNPELLKKLFTDIAKRYQGKKGGYTKLTIVGRRKGDNALIAKLALTIPEASVSSKKSAKTEKSSPQSSAKPTSKPTPVTPKVNAPKAIIQKGAKAVRSNVGTIRKTGER